MFTFSVQVRLGKALAQPNAHKWASNKSILDQCLEQRQRAFCRHLEAILSIASSRTDPEKKRPREKLHSCHGLTYYTVSIMLYGNMRIKWQQGTAIDDPEFAIDWKKRPLDRTVILRRLFVLAAR